MRELSHLMERVTLLHPEDVIEAAALDHFCLPCPTGERAPGVVPPPSAEVTDEPTRIRRALIRTGGNVVRAAQLLGLRRDALRYRMRRYGIRPPTLAELTAGPPPTKARGAGKPPDAMDDRTAQAPPAASGRTSSGWEHKPVAVLAIDLTWPEAAALEAPPQEPWTVVARWEQEIVEKVQGFGGVILQHTPSLLLVAFGIPRTLDQQPQRAVQAALALRQLRLGEGPSTGNGPRPALRLGLHWGPLLVATEAPEPPPSIRAVGETLAIPVRLLGHALPGDMRLQLAGPMPRPVRPFVGRARELAVLAEVWAQARAGQGQAVGIIGEPGIGKSRLLAEFLGTSQPMGARVLETRALAYTQTTPYRPIVDLLRGYCGIDERDDGPTVRTKVTRQLAHLELTHEPVLSPLLSLLEGPLDDPTWPTLEPSLRRQRTLEAIRQILRGESRVQPLIVVCEDLHWSDHETQAVLDRLVDGLTDVPLLLLVTARPESPPAWGGQAAYTALRLEPLPHAHTTVLLEEWLGTDATLPPLTSRLIERTQGNPFFLEEGVHTLLETGVLVGRPGAYALARPVDRLQVPATVQTVLAARIDRLPQEEKTLLQTAAVIGHEVPFLLLQAMAEVPEATLDRRLDHLEALEFLYETGRFPERAFRFKHALTQEVAYGSLLQERRRTLHARIVEILERSSAAPLAEQVERLAHHALRGEVWEKAVTYGQQAGARAYDRAAFREAVAAFEQALQALARLPDDDETRGLAIDLRYAIGNPLTALGEQRRYLALLGEAEALARTLEDRARLGRVLVKKANQLRLGGDHVGAIAASQQALDLATALGNHVLEREASFSLGREYSAIGDFGRAAALLRRSVEAVDRESGTPRIDVRIQSRAWLTRTLSALGAFAEGLHHGEEALRLAMLDGPGRSPIFAHGCLGLLYLTRGDLEPAIRALEQGLAFCRASGNRDWFTAVVACLGSAYALQGRLAEGHALLEEGITENIRIDRRQNHALWVAWLSEVCRLAGRGEEAWQHAYQALELARQYKERGSEAVALHQLGTAQAHAHPSDVARAEAYYQQALALAEELGMRPLVAHCHLGLGMLYGKISRTKQARTTLTTAIELYRAMDMTFWLPQAEVTLAQLDT